VAGGSYNWAAIVVIILIAAGAFYLFKIKKIALPALKYNMAKKTEKTKDYTPDNVRKIINQDTPQATPTATVASFVTAPINAVSSAIQAVADKMPSMSDITQAKQPEVPIQAELVPTKRDDSPGTVAAG
jgi:hypothetical protein